MEPKKSKKSGIFSALKNTFWTGNITGKSCFKKKGSKLKSRTESSHCNFIPCDNYGGDTLDGDPGNTCERTRNITSEPVIVSDIRGSSENIEISLVEITESAIEGMPRHTNSEQNANYVGTRTSEHQDSATNSASDGPIFFTVQFDPPSTFSEPQHLVENEVSSETDVGPITSEQHSQDSATNSASDGPIFFTVHFDPPSTFSEPQRLVENEVSSETDALGNQNKLESNLISGSLLNELQKLSKCGWYWGNISKKEAEEKLTDQPDGAFLLRDSSADHFLLSLSFRSSGKTLHTRIVYSFGLFSFHMQPEDSFSSIAELIEHSMFFSKSAVLCYSRPRSPGHPAFPVRLTKPVSRFAQVRSLQHLCRFVIRESIRLDNIQKLPLPPSIKGYIEEGHY